MDHTAKSGEPKIVERCAYPLTGIGCVSRIYTDLAVLDIAPDGLVVMDMAPGVDLPALQALTAYPLRPGQLSS